MREVKSYRFLLRALRAALDFFLSRLGMPDVPLEEGICQPPVCDLGEGQGG